MTTATTLSRDILTTQEREYFDRRVAFWRRRNAADVARYKDEMRKRQGACWSGFDPSPVKEFTEAQLEAIAMDETIQRRRTTIRQPYQVILNVIGNRMASRDAECANLARRLKFASECREEHIFAMVPAIDAAAERHPDLIRDMADAKHCLDAMVMLVPDPA